jgi:hypothetical protein
VQRNWRLEKFEEAAIEAYAEHLVLLKGMTEKIKAGHT